MEDPPIDAQGESESLTQGNFDDQNDPQLLEEGVREAPEGSVDLFPDIATKDADTDSQTVDSHTLYSRMVTEEVRESIEHPLNMFPNDENENGAGTTESPGKDSFTNHSFRGLSQTLGASQVETQEHDESMQNVRDISQTNDGMFNGDPQVQDRETSAVTDADEPQEDETSLFIPEKRTPTTPRPRPARLAMQPPPRPTATPIGRTPTPSTSRTPNSTFAKIRSMQQRLKQNKANASSPRSSYQPQLDDEAYLAAAQSFSGVRRMPSEHPETTDTYDMEGKKAIAEFQKQKRKYDQLKFQNNGKLTFREDIEWIKIQSAEQSRREKRKRDLQRAKEDEEPVLFPDFQGSRGSHVDESSDQEDANDSGFDFSSPSGKRRPAMPRKLEKQVSMQEAELQSMRVALDAEPDLPKKKRTRSDDSQKPSSAVSSNRSSRGKAKVTTPRTRTKATGSTAKRPRQTAKARKEAAAAVRRATSLFTADVFANQAAQDAPDEPTFRARNKQDALKELIASVPIESLKSARGDTAALMHATKDFDGRGSVKADGNGMWLVKGMRTSLKAYQIMGSAFMRRRENAVDQPRGGLMADQMGLGKTLMMLANIVNGHPGKQAKCKTTLLVASQALLTQWKREIELHTSSGLTVMNYSSGSRIDSNVATEILEGHDIILTTYTEIMKSYPKNEPPIYCQTAEEKLEWWKETYDQNRGALHRMLFYRVVLDEAQAIKNHTSRTSIACRALMAQHKWALSGTPILNSLTELYPYFKFLGVPHTGSFKIFKHNYCANGDTENQERLLLRLSQFMIRRTHGDEMFGAPILKLPKADQQVYWCEFNPVERAIYEIVRQRFAKHINMWAKKGELAKSYSNALVMLLRLRQLTAHVLMLQYVMQDLLEREDIELVSDIVKNAACDSGTRSGATILAIRKQLDDFASGKLATTPNLIPEDGDDDDDDVEEPTPVDPDDFFDDEGNRIQPRRRKTGANFGKNYNFKPYLNSLSTGDEWEKKKKRAQCAACGRSPPRYPWLTSCGHLMCHICYEEANLIAAENGQAHSSCTGCGKMFDSATELSVEEQEQLNAGPETRSKRQRHDRHREKLAQQDISDEWLNINGGESILPSAKTIAIKAQLMNWFEEKGDENPKKVIIYTQFLAMIRILNKMCQEEGWQTEQYHGKLSFTARDKAIGHFDKDPNVRVLLASLRCGGLGLNLTMASRVIVIDPWWNSAAEQQAFCRVFRFGQKETTYMTKLCVKNTVDERLIEMQEKKQKEIDEVMDNKNKTASGMSLRDLMRLFGNLQEDDNGQPFILVDNPDPRGGFRADRWDEGYADDN